MSDQIYFEKATLAHEETIFKWLAEPHMQEFWDNTPEHKNDILNFIYGRKQHYFAGTTMYWVALINAQPFAFILSDEILPVETDLPHIYREHLSKTGRTISLDFGIGNKDFLGKGLAATTLMQFTTFYQKQIDPLADVFLIDPDENNPRALHVYEKAGFKLVGNYVPSNGAFIGSTSYLMVKHFYNDLVE